ncbi:TPA: hypothetical protein ACQJXM_000450, partial [Citrobacter freundii]
AAFNHALSCDLQSSTTVPSWPEAKTLPSSTPDIESGVKEYAPVIFGGGTKSHLSACAQKEHNVNTVNSIHLIIIILLLT